MMKYTYKALSLPLMAIPLVAIGLDKLYRKNIYKRKCIFMSQPEFSSLDFIKKSKYFLHKLYDPKTKAKKRIVVIGAGIVGVT